MRDCNPRRSDCFPDPSQQRAEEAAFPIVAEREQPCRLLSLSPPSLHILQNQDVRKDKDKAPFFNKTLLVTVSGPF
jgi:hypothetical protein